MSRRLEKLIEQKAWETLTDYGYNDAHLLEQLTESVLERFANLDEGGHVGAGKQVMNPMSGTPDVLGFSRRAAATPGTLDPSIFPRPNVPKADPDHPSLPGGTVPTDNPDIRRDVNDPNIYYLWNGREWVKRKITPRI